jgi:hypothetical protein
MGLGRTIIDHIVNQYLEHRMVFLCHQSVLNLTALGLTLHACT